MNFTKTVSIGSKVYIVFSILSLAYVSLLSIINPQATMDLVNVQLSNTDAISSIRGIYGGVGIALVISLTYFLFTSKQKAVVFLTLFWGLYAISRFITAVFDGPLGDFGLQWILIESVLCSIGLLLIALGKFK